jgi:hypothetical protein
MYSSFPTVFSYQFLDFEPDNVPSFLKIYQLFSSSALDIPVSSIFNRVSSFDPGVKPDSLEHHDV